MQRLEVSGAVRHIYIYIVRRQRVKETLTLTTKYIISGFEAFHPFSRSPPPDTLYVLLQIIPVMSVSTTTVTTK
jgi:hypothetical protein